MIIHEKKKCQWIVFGKVVIYRVFVSKAANKRNQVMFQSSTENKSHSNRERKKENS